LVRGPRGIEGVVHQDDTAIDEVLGDRSPERLRRRASAGLVVGEGAGQLHHLGLFGQYGYGEALDPLRIDLSLLGHFGDGPAGAQTGLHLPRRERALRPGAVHGRGRLVDVGRVVAAFGATLLGRKRVDEAVFERDDESAGLRAPTSTENEPLAVGRESDEVELSHPGSYFLSGPHLPGLLPGR